MKNGESLSPRKPEKKKIVGASGQEYTPWSPDQDGGFQEVARPLSDTERMSYFLETGDMSYLTQEQATAIKTAMAKTENSYDKHFLSEMEKQTGISAEQARQQPLQTTFHLLIHQDEPRYVAFMRNYGDLLYEDLDSYAHDDPRTFASLITEQLDFKHPQSFASTSRTLELLRNFYIEMLHREQDDLDVEDFHGDLEQKNPERFAQLTEGSTLLVETLKQAIERREGSYLLHARAQEVLVALEAPELEYGNTDGEPFKLTRGRYAGFNNDKSVLYIAPTENNPEIESYLRGDKEHKDRGHYTAFYSSIIDSGDHLDVEALKKMGVNVTEAELRDYYFLQSEPMRERIKNDFEIHIEQLSIPEQFQLLMFLKTVEKKDASPLFLQATRFLQKQGTLDLNNIRGGSLEVRAGGEMPPADVERILDIQMKRYRDHYPAELLAKLRADLSSALNNNPQARFYIYRKGGEIVTLLRFDEPIVGEDGRSRKHMASFLTNPDFEGGALGQALLATASEREVADGSVIHGECDPPLAQKYIELGFVMQGAEYLDNGVPTINFELDPTTR